MPKMINEPITATKYFERFTDQELLEMYEELSGEQIIPDDAKIRKAVQEMNELYAADKLIHYTGRIYVGTVWMFLVSEMARRFKNLVLGGLKDE